VPDGERWDGVPAVPAGMADAPESPSSAASQRLSATAYGVLLLGSRSLLAWLLVAPVLLAAVVLLWLSDVAASDVIDWLWQPSSSPQVILLLVALAIAAVLSRLVMSALLLRYTKPVVAGHYLLGSFDYLRIW